MKTLSIIALMMTGVVFQPLFAHTNDSAAQAAPKAHLNGLIQIAEDEEEAFQDVDFSPAEIFRYNFLKLEHELIPVPDEADPEILD